MAIASMQKVEIFSHKSEKDKVLSDLQTLGVMDIQNFSEIHHQTKYASFSSEDSPEIETIEKQLNSVQFTLKYLAPFMPKQSFIEKISGQRLRITSQEFQEITEEYDYQSIVDQCHTFYQQDNTAHRAGDKTGDRHDNGQVVQGATEPVCGFGTYGKTGPDYRQGT